MYCKKHTNTNKLKFNWICICCLKHFFFFFFKIYFYILYLILLYYCDMNQLDVIQHILMIECISGLKLCECTLKGHSFWPEVIRPVWHHRHRWCKATQWAQSQFQWEGSSFGPDKGALFSSLPPLWYMTRTLFLCYSICSFEGKLSCPLWVWPNRHSREEKVYLLRKKDKILEIKMYWSNTA